MISSIGEKRQQRFPSTLRDVADRAAVSSATVSRVLSDKPGFHVRPATRKRIIKAAKELNYRPNAAAKSLRIKKTSSVALFIPDMDNPVYTEIIRGAEKAANDVGYYILISHLDERSIREKAYLTWLREHRVDGLLMGTGHLEDTAIDELIETGSPFVLFFGRSSATNNHVTLNDAAGMKLAIDHLVQQGHQQIAYLSGPLIYETSMRRLQGYRLGLHAHNLPFEPELMVEGDWSCWSDGARAMRGLLAKKRKFTAVLGATLTISIGALVELRRTGLRVPADVSIIGFHDSHLAEITHPPLTVVKMPLFDMGYKAMETLYLILNNQPHSVPIVLPEIKLIRRKSTDRPKIR
jgi:LacI family transcriptional regulator